jgi:hypothetical protein
VLEAKETKKMAGVTVKIASIQRSERSIFCSATAGAMEVVQTLRVLTVKCEKHEAVRLVGIEGFGGMKGKSVGLERADFGRGVL